jgi:radical SAM superfamily enzyme YgiQ (UPF0313 family)
MSGKARPDCVTRELAHELRRLGVMRMFVGVEYVSEAGQQHLNRRTTTEQIERAVAALRDAGIFVCYNLLLFEPDTRLEDVRDNLAFMRRHAHTPVSFCRAEPYHGTLLYQRVTERGIRSGSFFDWDYGMIDPRAELMFRICAVAAGVGSDKPGC